MSRETVPNQRLHLAFGGELADLCFGEYVERVSDDQREDTADRP